jgi:hypothetical protein
LHHPEVQIVAATSRQADGIMIADMHPSLTPSSRRSDSRSSCSTM